MSADPAAQSKYLSRQYIDGVYIPSGLLIVGCLIVKREWLPYAVAIALMLGGWKVYNSRTYSTDWTLQSCKVYL
jgi:cytochrome-b5 reductase